MEAWELQARESIRDLVARYNAYGDSVRIDQLLELFTPDAVMDTEMFGVKTGRDEIRTIFTGVRDQPRSDPAASDGRRRYLRHMVVSHVVDVHEPTHASGHATFVVTTANELTWGRYVDDYRANDGVWRFARRHMAVDGRTPLPQTDASGS